jgi:hypothetical protein
VLEPRVPGARPEVPEQWPLPPTTEGAPPVSPAPTTARDTKAAGDVGWRDFFVDPKLEELVARSLANNRDFRIAVLNVEGVLRQCVEARDLPVVDRALLRPASPHFLGVIVDVNPVSPAMLEQMRRWVSRPSGSTGITPGDALFGSFVGLFVRSIGASDATLRFRTQTFLP